MSRGTFTVVDGLDGVGKGVVIGALERHLRNKGMRVLNLHHYWLNNRDHPDMTNRDSPLYVDPTSFDALISAEPTFVGIGKVIREEIIAKNGRIYPAGFTAGQYAADRRVLYERVLVPVLEAGVHVVQSRSVSTSIVYQPIQAEGQEEDFSLDDVLAMEGNQFALQHAPDLLLVPTIPDVEEVMARLKGRTKDDNCEFENLDFQLKAKPHYEGEALRSIFESRGCHVKYMDAGVSIDYSRAEGVKIFRGVTGL